AAARQTVTDATTLVLAADERRSGYAEATSWRAGAIDPAAVALEACAKATRTRDPDSVEPRRFRAVLEPYAVADLLKYFAYDAFGAIGLLEGRSYLGGRIGEQIVD